MSDNLGESAGQCRLCVPWWLFCCVNNLFNMLLILSVAAIEVSGLSFTLNALQQRGKIELELVHMVSFENQLRPAE